MLSASVCKAKEATLIPPVAPPKRNEGYYQQPNIFQDVVVFVCEGDIWQLRLQDGPSKPQRLTSEGCCSLPYISPDGRKVAYTSSSSGSDEAYVCDIDGGNKVQVTFLAADTKVVGWTPDAKEVIVNSNFREAQPSYSMESFAEFLHVDARGGQTPEDYRLGDGRHLCFGPDGKGALIGRHTYDCCMANWWHYRGGRVGQLWLDRTGEGNFVQLLPDRRETLDCPMWIGERIFFLAEANGITNLHSMDLDGSNWVQHTFHADFHARQSTSDGSSIVYHLGGSLYVFNIAANTTNEVAVAWQGPRAHVGPHRLLSPATSVQDYCLHPNGQSCLALLRCRVFEISLRQGPAIECYADMSVHAMTYLCDGRALLVGSARTDGDSPVVFRAVVVSGINLKCCTPVVLDETNVKDFGFVNELSASPNRPQVVICNNRCQLLFLDLSSPAEAVLDEIDTTREDSGFSDVRWSSDGSHFAYVKPLCQVSSMIRIYSLKDKSSLDITNGRFEDSQPAFDPNGQFIYFASTRDMLPVADQVQADYGYPKTHRLYAVALRKHIPSPFNYNPAPPGPDMGGQSSHNREGSSDGDSDEQEQLQIDADGILDRICPFPLGVGRYDSLWPIKDGRVVYRRMPISISERSNSGKLEETEQDEEGGVFCFDFQVGKERPLRPNGAKQLFVSADLGTVMAVLEDGLLVAAQAGEKLTTDSDPPDECGSQADHHLDRKNLELRLDDRLYMQIDPFCEWRDMFDDTWLRMKEKYWHPSLHGVDWNAKHKQYRPLVDRVSTRKEFGDVLHEMLIELATSHIYLTGGDLDETTKATQQQGHLGAHFIWDKALDGYRITDIVRGDPWSDKFVGPLIRIGVEVTEDDVLVAINSRKLTPEYPPVLALADCANREVLVTVESAKQRSQQRQGASAKSKKRRADDEEESSTEKGHSQEILRTYRTIAVSRPMVRVARYRDWVRDSLQFVHANSDERVGYVHLSDMEETGLTEFYRYYLIEARRPGLILDIRWNPGGNISAIVLRKLLQRQLGWHMPRYARLKPSPDLHAPRVLVLIADENTSSDGDIMADAFKYLKLGPVVGHRTWRGVCMTQPETLADGTQLFKPEFGYSMLRGQQVENRGVDPDVPVDYTPQSYRSNDDPQLRRAVDVAVGLLEKTPAPAPPPESDHEHVKEYDNIAAQLPDIYNRG